MITNRKLLKKDNNMSKSSKSCEFISHIRVLNKEHSTKATYESEQARSHGVARSHGIDKGSFKQHPKHKVEYPEVVAQANNQAQCKCGKK